MFISFFESFKYLGHLWPIALLRIYFGYVFLQAGIYKIKHDFLTTPALQTILDGWVKAAPHQDSYTQFLQNWVIPHWQVFSYMVVSAEVLIGICYILGFFVRPAAIIAIILNLNILLAGGAEVAAVNQVFIAVNAALLMVGAGRCLGFDYHFYKRIRGIWW